MIALAKNFLIGSIPPLVTPFKNGAVDHEVFQRLVEFQIANGTHGILVNGTTAEPSSLTVAERNRQVDAAIEAAAGRVPVVAATGSQSLAETVALTQHAVRAGDLRGHPRDARGARVRPDPLDRAARDVDALLRLHGAPVEHRDVRDVVGHGGASRSRSAASLPAQPVASASASMASSRS